MLAALLASGCGAALLPGTVFHVPLDGAGAPDTDAWSALAARAPSATVGAGAFAWSVVAAEPLEGDGWLAWTARSAGDASHVAGTLIRASRTAVGLEAQAIGAHVGPAFRVTLRRIEVERAALVLVESSESERSIERAAWIYVERAASIDAADLGDGGARLPMRHDSREPLDERWDRARTVTATFEGGGDALIVHEHATTCEVARGRPEVPPRAVREIDRDRRLVLDGLRLVADRPSLFDEP